MSYCLAENVKETCSNLPIVEGCRDNSDWQILTVVDFAVETGLVVVIRVQRLSYMILDDIGMQRLGRTRRAANQWRVEVDIPDNVKCGICRGLKRCERKRRKRWGTNSPCCVPSPAFVPVTSVLRSKLSLRLCLRQEEETPCGKGMSVAKGVYEGHSRAHFSSTRSRLHRSHHWARRRIFSHREGIRRTLRHRLRKSECRDNEPFASECGASLVLQSTEFSLCTRDRQSDLEEPMVYLTLCRSLVQSLMLHIGYST